MKMNIIKIALFGTVATALSLASCSKDNGPGTTNPEDTDRWITVSGAMMDEEAGDGNGGTMIYSVSADQAKDPNISINVFDNGSHVKSQRTARLQASADGDFLYNIQYVGDDGGIFNKYSVHGKKDFRPSGPEVETATYVSTSPRWLKAAEGVGVAVRATATNEYDGANPLFTFKKTQVEGDVITLDLHNPKITKTASFDLALSAEEVAQHYYISRIDVPVINKAGTKVFIGAAVNKLNPLSFTINDSGLPVFANDTKSQKSWAKTLVLDYPSLTNPKILTSTQTRGNTNGYRSTMQYVGTDGNIYQATSGEAAGTGGSKILRISASSNDYDNSYVFSLDQALGLTDTYIETWKYVGDGIGFVIYNFPNSEGKRTGGYIARVDLNSKTATKYDIPNEDNLNFRQIQNIALDGDDVYIAVAAIGQDGNILVFNRKSGEMNVGAKLINKTGNQYIGVY